MTEIFSVFNLRTKICAVLLMLLPVIMVITLLPNTGEIQNSIIITCITFLFANIILIYLDNEDKTKIYKKCFPNSNNSGYILPAQKILIDNNCNIINNTDRNKCIDSLVNKFHIQLNNNAMNIHDADKCIRWILNETKDIHKFPAIYEKNISFSFRVHLRLIQPFGISLSLIISAIELLLVIYKDNINFDTSNITLISYIVINIITLIISSWMSSNKRIKYSGEQYGKLLLKTYSSLI